MLTAMAGEDPNDPRTQGLPPVPDLVTAATPVLRGRKVKVRWKTRVGVHPRFTSGTTEMAAARRAASEHSGRVQDLHVVDVTAAGRVGRFHQRRLQQCPPAGT